MGSLLLLLLFETLRKPITITSPLLLHLLLLLNQRNTKQTDYKVIFTDLYYFHGITHYHRHIITDNIIIKLSFKFCRLLLSNRESNSLLLANSATYYYYYYYYRQYLTRLLLSLLLLLWNFEKRITITITFTPKSLHYYYYYYYY